jgi:hypothetical protein
MACRGCIGGAMALSDGDIWGAVAGRSMGSKHRYGKYRTVHAMPCKRTSGWRMLGCGGACIRAGPLLSRILAPPWSRQMCPCSRCCFHFRSHILSIMAAPLIRTHTHTHTPKCYEFQLGKAADRPPAASGSPPNRVVKGLRG